jgi:uncharacterized protein (TIGR03086 family)
MDILASYQRAQDGFDTILAAVPPRQWDAPSACELWTVRDVAGHVIWAQEQLRHWANGTEYGNDTGAPGASHPAELAGDDPLATWRTAREATAATLTADALARTVPLTGLGDVPLAGVLTLLVTDTVAHTWDIGQPLGLDVRLDPELVEIAFAWSRQYVVRQPGFFGPEQTPGPDADEQLKLMAYLGRVARQPQLT